MGASLFHRRFLNEAVPYDELIQFPRPDRCTFLESVCESSLSLSLSLSLALEIPRDPMLLATIFYKMGQLSRLRRCGMPSKYIPTHIGYQCHFLVLGKGRFSGFA